ncbi:hypothetical protein CcCBS67573_g06130 [Chytriomyces confervae]|uniref:Uncharacterized protein n=1 Tax=Chytriomyces confervae TaxID=246404 RepID=A0A507F668_9FUNG|nr:hypothetical protein CcCBS67573_g06130 [Chytriomyces confervae]
MNDAYKYAPSNAPNAPKTGLAKILLASTMAPVARSKLWMILAESSFLSIKARRTRTSASSSTRANTLEILLLSPELAVTSLSTVKSEVRRQPSLTRANSRTRAKRQKNASPSIFNESQKKVTPASLLLSSTSRAPSRKPSVTAEPPNVQTQTFFESFFLFPAYDHKGRRISVESLAAFVAMFVLFWLIPFVAAYVGMESKHSAVDQLLAQWLISTAYNPIYNLCSINLLAASISIIFLCDSIVSLATPLLVNS